MNKKAQGLSLTTVILIVLGLVVLVFLIYGFSTGWKNLWETITQYTGGAANIDTIKQACLLACSANNQYNFCNLERTVKYGQKVKAWNGTDIEGKLEDGVLKGGVTQSPGTCENMTSSQNYPNVNVAPCPGLC